MARLWAGLSLAAIGDQLQRMAVIWIAVQLAGSNAGFVASAEMGAVLVVALFAGAWTERWDHRRTMIATDLIRAVLALIPVAAWLTGRLDLWTVVIPSVALAGLRGVFDPALQGSLPRLASEPRLLVSANALMDATQRIARLVGPGVAGALAAVMPAVGLMAINAASFVASALAVGSLKRELPRQTHDASRSRREMLLVGVRAVRAQPIFLWLLALGAVMSGFWMVALWLCVPLIVQTSGLTAFGLEGLAVVGLITGAYGAGNVAGNLFVGGVEIRRPLRMVFGGNVIVGSGLAMAGVAALLAPQPLIAPMMMAGCAFAAFGGPICDVPAATLRQTVFAAHEVPAVYRLLIVFDWGGMTLATALAPFVLGLASPAAVMVASAVGMALVSVAGFLRRDLGVYDGAFATPRQSPMLAE
ncbi:MAG: MFS transporter [Phenylobacterium sp.]|nr:MFS transporter [Phenylobacterium sp.]